MNSSTIKKRLDRLMELIPPTSTCIVCTENGVEMEVPVKVLVQNIGTMKLVRMVNCTLPELDELLEAGWKEAQDESKYPPSAE